MGLAGARFSVDFDPEDIRVVVHGPPVVLPLLASPCTVCTIPGGLRVALPAYAVENAMNDALEGAIVGETCGVLLPVIPNGIVFARL